MNKFNGTRPLARYIIATGSAPFEATRNATTKGASVVENEQYFIFA